jgi:hypothetical protein
MATKTQEFTEVGAWQRIRRSSFVDDSYCDFLCLLWPISTSLWLTLFSACAEAGEAGDYGLTQI